MAALTLGDGAAGVESKEGDDGGDFVNSLEFMSSNHLRQCCTTRDLSTPGYNKRDMARILASALRVGIVKGLSTVEIGWYEPAWRIGHPGIAHLPCPQAMESGGSRGSGNTIVDDMVRARDGSITRAGVFEAKDQQRKDEQVDCNRMEEHMINSVLPCLANLYRFPQPGKREGVVYRLRAILRGDTGFGYSPLFTQLLEMQRGWSGTMVCGLVVAWRDDRFHRNQPVAIATCLQSAASPCAANVAAEVMKKCQFHILFVDVHGSSRDALRRSESLPQQRSAGDDAGNRGRSGRVGGEHVAYVSKKASEASRRLGFPAQQPPHNKASHPPREGVGPPRTNSSVRPLPTGGVGGEAGGSSKRGEGVEGSDAWKPGDVFTHLAVLENSVREVLNGSDVDGGKVNVCLYIAATPRGQLTHLTNAVEVRAFVAPEPESAGGTTTKWGFRGSGDPNQAFLDRVTNAVKAEFKVCPAPRYALGKPDSIVYSRSSHAAQDRQLHDSSGWARLANIDGGRKRSLELAFLKKLHPPGEEHHGSTSRTRIDYLRRLCAPLSPWNPVECHCGGSCWREDSTPVCEGVTTIPLSSQRWMVTCEDVDAATEGKTEAPAPGVVPHNFSLLCGRCSAFHHHRKMHFVVEPGSGRVAVCLDCRLDTDVEWSPGAANGDTDTDDLRADDAGMADGWGGSEVVEVDERGSGAGFDSWARTQLGLMVGLLRLALEKSPRFRTKHDGKKIDCFEAFVQHINNGGVLFPARHWTAGAEQDDESVTVVLPNYDYRDGKVNQKGWPTVIRIERFREGTPMARCRCKARSNGHNHHFYGHLWGVCFHELVAYALAGCTPYVGGGGTTAKGEDGVEDELHWTKTGLLGAAEQQTAGRCDGDMMGSNPTDGGASGGDNSADEGGNWTRLARACHLSDTGFGETGVEVVIAHHPRLHMLVFVSLGKVVLDSTGGASEALVSASAMQLKCSEPRHTTQHKCAGKEGCAHMAAVRVAVATGDLTVAPRNASTVSSSGEPAEADFVRAPYAEPEAQWFPERGARGEWGLDKRDLSNTNRRSNDVTLSRGDKAQLGVGLSSASDSPELLHAAHHRPVSGWAKAGEEVGQELYEPLPVQRECGCGSEWWSEAEPDGRLQLQPGTTLVCYLHSTESAHVLDRVCCSDEGGDGVCRLHATGEAQKIHRVTAVSAIAEEVLVYGFEQFINFRHFKSTCLRKSLQIFHRIRAASHSTSHRLPIDSDHWDKLLRWGLYGFVTRLKSSKEQGMQCPACPRISFQYRTPTCPRDGEPGHDHDACVWSHGVKPVREGSAWYGKYIIADGKAMSLKESKQHSMSRHEVGGDDRPKCGAKTDGGTRYIFTKGVGPAIRARIKACLKKQVGETLTADAARNVYKAEYHPNDTEMAQISECCPEKMLPFVLRSFKASGVALQEEATKKADAGGPNVVTLRGLVKANKESRSVRAVNAFARECLAKPVAITNVLNERTVPYCVYLLSWWRPRLSTHGPPLEAELLRAEPLPKVLLSSLVRHLVNPKAGFPDVVANLFLTSPTDDAGYVTPARDLLDFFDAFLARRADVVQGQQAATYRAPVPDDDVYFVNPALHNPTLYGCFSYLNSTGCPLRHMPRFTKIADKSSRGDCEKPSWAKGAGSDGCGTYTIYCEHGFVQYAGLMSAHESSVDAIAPLFTDLPKLARDLIYVSDMSCAHSLFVANRFAGFFDSCQFMLVMSSLFNFSFLITVNILRVACLLYSHPRSFLPVFSNTHTHTH